MAFSILGGVAYRWLITSRGFSAATASKIIAGVAFSSAFYSFLCMALARSPGTAALLASLALASLALSQGSWSTNHAEIAVPEHAAALFSVANSISAATSVFGISLTGKLLDKFGGAEVPDAWAIAMGSIGALCGICGALFVTFARGNEVLFPGTTRAAASGVAGTGEPGGAEASQDGKTWPRPFGFGGDTLSSDDRERPNMLQSITSLPDFFASAPGSRHNLWRSSLGRTDPLSSVGTASAFRIDDSVEAGSCMEPNLNAAHVFPPV